MLALSLDDLVQPLLGITGATGIDYDCPLASLTVDSLDVVEWIVQLEERYGITIESVVAHDLSTTTLRQLYTQLLDSGELVRRAIPAD
jgi:acyl carrier protein